MSRRFKTEKSCQRPIPYITITIAWNWIHGCLFYWSQGWNEYPETQQQLPHVAQIYPPILSLCSRPIICHHVFLEMRISLPHQGKHKSILQLRTKEICSQDMQIMGTKTYHTVINLEPPALEILHIAHTMTRKSSIHDIQVNNYPI